MEREQLERYKIKFYKNEKIKKGWILTYVVVISMFVSLMIFYLMKSFENRNFYMSNYKLYNLKEDDDYMYRENIMVNFNKYVLSNLEDIKKETIEKYFKGKKGEKLVSYKESYITYDSDKRIFKINGLKRNYEFTITINLDKVICNFKGF